MDAKSTEDRREELLAEQARLQDEVHDLEHRCALQISQRKAKAAQIILELTRLKRLRRFALETEFLSIAREELDAPTFRRLYSLAHQRAGLSDEPAT